MRTCCTTKKQLLKVTDPQTLKWVKWDEFDDLDQVRTSLTEHLAKPNTAVIVKGQTCIAIWSTDNKFYWQLWNFSGTAELLAKQEEEQQEFWPEGHTAEQAVDTAILDASTC